MFHPRGPSIGELVRQGLSSTERGYDLLAPKFEYTPFATPDVVLKGAADVLAQDGPVDAILDLCCGTGKAARYFQPLCLRRMVGLDFSRGMLAEARQRMQLQPGGPEVAWIRGDARNMPFEAEFNAVVSFGALGHFRPKDTRPLLQGIRRCLKPGGRFLFVTTEKPGPGSLSFWLCHGFNAAMRVRNLLLSPPFIMYYLTFALPDVLEDLRAEGFRTEVRDRLFPRPFHPFKLVIATRAGSPELVESE